MADQAETIQMIIADVAGTGPFQLRQTAGIGAETDEMNIIGKTRLNVIEVVADIDDAVLGKSGCGYGPGQNLALVATAICAVGEG